jgi:hypothetical protein
LRGIGFRVLHVTNHPEQFAAIGQENAKRLAMFVIFFAAMHFVILLPPTPLLAFLPAAGAALLAVLAIACGCVVAVVIAAD